jgi:hypothetical protein
MTDPLPHALPYGLRDVKLTPYTDLTCTELGAPVDLPVSRTLSFSETEDFNQLEGDDEIVATHGSGPQVEWELESGGISFQAWAVMSGATYDATSDRRVLKKSTSQQRPYFKIEGQIISDSGGDIHCEVFRAKADDTLEGEFGYGEFFLTSCKGHGFGSLMVVDDADESVSVALGDLYRFVQNGTITNISSGPAAPASVTAAAATGSSPTASSALSWPAVTGADSYKVERSKDNGSWIAGTPATAATGSDPVTNTQTGLSSGSWRFRVITVRDGVDSAPSSPTSAVVVA